ncbi:hypothetical protein GQ53DRAFT_852230 [Thozetella sp. PMI_491]|nr:hypothetical protein GQ53DRAFT_852230 [Thozetella sp. PMI_491]
MGSLGYREGVAVVQLIFFTVYLGCAIVLCSRHGWNRTSGFLILITFSLLRLLGASFQLATIAYPTRSVYGGAIICEAIGVSPLTVLNLGSLARLNRFLPTAQRIGAKFFGAISLASMVGIGLAIKGGIQAAESTVTGTPNTLVKVAIVIFLAIYLASVAIFITIWMARSLIPQGERRLLASFAVCAPLILVRLIYPLIADFGGNADFYVFGGNPTIWLCMAVLEEIIVVAIVVSVGLTLEKLPKISPEGDRESQTDEMGQKISN